MREMQAVGGHQGSLTSIFTLLIEKQIVFCLLTLSLIKLNTFTF
jgi:hypothetical protein